MPTVSDLINQIADESGLNAADGVDVAVILRSLNRAQRAICSRIPMLTWTSSSAAWVGDGVTTQFDVSTYERVHEVVLFPNGALNRGPHTLLDHLPLSEVTGSTTTSPPTGYAQYGDMLLTNGPVPASMTLAARVDPYPTTLTTTDPEPAIAIPPSFHEDALATRALTYILEGYEGDEQRAAYYRQLAERAEADLKEWVRRRSGMSAPNSRPNASHFHTPDPLEIR